MHVAFSTIEAAPAQYRSRTSLREEDVKLEPELLRELLLHVEEHATEVYSELEQIQLSGWSDKQVTYHVVKATEAGLLNASIDKLPDDKDPIILHISYNVHALSFNGHEFLEKVRDPKNWRDVKRGATAVGSFSVKVLAAVAEAVVAAKIKQLTGLGD